MKLLAMYLPQFHEIRENNEWWGKGYTEWTAVKRACPLFANHYQPNIPLNSNYYDLADESGETWKWQAKLAREYGLYGFCIYHYWFGEKQLLEKPMEILLKHPEIDINYCVCWANETWTRTWYDQEKTVLIEQKYGDMEEYKRHYNYLSNFFKDDRYIKIDNRPLINIYRQADIPNLDDMLECWENMAKNDGFSGVYVVTSLNSVGNGTLGSNLIKAQYMFEPGFSTKNGLALLDKMFYYLPTAVKRLCNKLLHMKILEQKIDAIKINRRIIKNYGKLKNSSDKRLFIGLFPKWDNTPRRGNKGTVYLHTEPQVFKHQLQEIKKMVSDEDFVYINAWNEWGEGAYLEPDERNGYSYLEAIKSVSEE